MRSTKQSLRGLLALAMLGMPAALPRVGELTPAFTAPKPPRRRAEPKPDPDRQFAAAVRREKKNWKRLWARSQGGWVSSDAWLAKKDLRWHADFGGEVAQ